MKVRRYILSLLTVSALFFASCSTGKNQRILSFFFDGVPLPDSTLASEESSEPLTGYDDQSIDSSMISLVPVYTLHYPYEEKECMSCHNENSLGDMVLPEPDLCYMCHDDFSASYAWVHGPAAGGYCTQCHDAHKSENDYLLKRSGQDICTWCHDLNQAPHNDMHTDLGDTECTLCHNPHGGEDKFLMR